MAVGFLQILIVAAIVLFLFFPKKIGRVGYQLGRFVMYFKGSSKLEPSEGEVDWVKNAASAAKKAQKVRSATRKGGFPWP